jgi:hypothetical protein
MPTLARPWGLVLRGSIIRTSQFSAQTGSCIEPHHQMAANASECAIAVKRPASKVERRKDRVAMERRHHERLEQPVLALGLASPAGPYQRAEAMTHSSKEFHDETVTLTWCACELCNSVGPRSMVLVRNHHEYRVELHSHCCNPGAEEELVCGEGQHSDGRHSQRNQIPG